MKDKIVALQDHRWVTTLIESFNIRVAISALTNFHLMKIIE